MTNDELSRTLEKLHIELSQASNLDPQTTRLLRNLLEEIQTVIARSGDDESTDNQESLSLSRRWNDVIVDFEVRHPQLTATLSQITNRLSEMGI